MDRNKLDASGSGNVGEESRQALIEITATLVTLRERLAEVESLRKNLLETSAVALEKVEEIRALAAASLTAKTQIQDDQSVVAAKSAHIQNAQEHADKVRAELDRVLTLATQQAVDAEGHKSRAHSANDTAAELLAGVRAVKATVDADSEAISVARELAKASGQTLKSLAEKSEEIEQRVDEYEKRLMVLDKEAQSKLETINGLLPGATAAGLAHAFDLRRQTFLNPSARWQWLFVGSVGALVVLALTGLLSAYGKDGSIGWDELARLWIARFPIAGALVWLALHASRESALAKRLEEDYGYKAAVATSFLGFQKQMAEIGDKVQEGSPLSKLCADTLTTMANPPGRIYEKHNLTVSPAGEVVNAAVKAFPGNGADKQK